MHYTWGRARAPRGRGGTNPGRIGWEWAGPRRRHAGTRMGDRIEVGRPAAARRSRRNPVEAVEVYTHGRHIYWKRKTERRATPRSKSTSNDGADANRTQPNAILRSRADFRMIRRADRTKRTGVRRGGDAIHLALEKGLPNPNASPETKTQTQTKKNIKTCSTNFDKYRPSSECTQTSGRVLPSGLFFSMAFDVHRCTAVEYASLRLEYK